MKAERKVFLPNLALAMQGGIQMMRLRSASLAPRIASDMTLRKILSEAKDTEYGREHHFDEILKARGPEQLFRAYRKNVPVNDYEALRPYIEKHKNGESDILIPGKPLMYATTSGTTNAPKWVPMSKEYLNNVYSKMTKLWLYNFIKQRRYTFSGAVVFMVSKYHEGNAPDGTIFGSASGFVQHNAPDFIRQMYASIPEIFEITNYAAKYYALMRITMQRNVTLFVMPNPSSVLEMQKTVDENLDEIINDIEKGTISENFEISSDLRKKLLAKIKPDPARAAELRQLKEKYGRILPKHYWPHIQMMSTWKCGNTKIYVDKFADWFPNHTFYQELGYFSTECRFGLVLDNTINTVMFPHFHFYEFVEESELDSPDPHFYNIYELEHGKRYNAYVTTLSGLYRYNMNDLIEVGPKFENTPTVHMVQKVNGIVSLTGEKLHEKQFVDAVAKAEELTEMKTNFFVGFADVENSRYEFYYEFKDQNITQEQAETFTHAVDKFLQDNNEEYHGKRKSFRLQDPATHRLVKHAFDKFKKRCIEEGMRDGQFKLNLLLQDEKRRAKFKELEIK